MIRRSMNLACVLGTLCALVLWVRSYHHHDRWGFSTLESHYTFHSSGGRLFLTSSPPHRPIEDQLHAWDSLRRLTNDDIVWNELWRQAPLHLDAIDAEPLPASPAAALDRPGLERPLLRGLDSPKKFVAAHVLLYGMTQLRLFDNPRNANGIVSVDAGGLQVQLLPTAAKNEGETGDALDSMIIEHRGPQSVRFSMGQLRAIRNDWHDLLDVRRATVPHIYLVLGNAIFLACRWFVHRRARKKG